MRKASDYSPNQIMLKDSAPPSLTAFDADHVSQFKLVLIVVKIELLILGSQKRTVTNPLVLFMV